MWVEEVVVLGKPCLPYIRREVGPRGLGSVLLSLECAPICIHGFVSLAPFFGPQGRRFSDFKI